MKVMTVCAEVNDLVVSSLTRVLVVASQLDEQVELIYQLNVMYIVTQNKTALPSVICMQEYLFKFIKPAVIGQSVECRVLGRDVLDFDHSSGILTIPRRKIGTSPWPGNSELTLRIITRK